ncbi:hypothetical protein JD292_01600 [Leucobacter sp. CSA2]|uniref:Uncharacterized protein n=1 Tax=Leucobacter edaphi TaxID=2796472 RepID=A0A934QCK1_9MICO|nr:hypothetical protein [Leucobacter edaphi]MBK0420777.1 hypothetical protein [Leucobacter edaphi]
MSHRRTRRSSLGLLAAAIGVALLLTSCSGGGEKKSSEQEMGPLDKYMMALSPASDMTQEKLDEQHKKTEELVAKCMAKEGFEYKPDPTNHSTISPPDGAAEDVDWTSVEFAEKYGYGFVDSPYLSQTNPESTSPSEQEEWVDVNEDYVASLSEKQREAYYEALHGPANSMDPAEGEEPPAYDWKTAGCYGAAQHEVEGADGYQDASEDPEFTEIFDAVLAQSTSLHGDGTTGPTNPEVRKLDAKWAECMAESGITGYASTGAASTAIMEESNALSESASGESGAAPSKEKFEALKKKEISIAVPDAKCREKLHYEEEIRKIDFAFQEKFVAEHKAKLEALVAKYAPKKKS